MSIESWRGGGVHDRAGHSGGVFGLPYPRAFRSLGGSNVLSNIKRLATRFFLGFAGRLIIFPLIQDATK